MQHSLRKHAKYGASSAYRWMACPGSVKLAEAMPPQPSTSYAIDGTEAHELLDFALKNKHWDAIAASKAHGTYERDTAFDAGGRLGAVQMALDYVEGILDAYDDAVLYVEHPFVFPSNVTDDAWGTCDVCIHVPSLGIVYIIDYKHGAGYAVDVDGNKQALIYSTGAVLGSGNLDAEVIINVIIQPRAFHAQGPIREAVVRREHLEDFVYEVDAAILATQEPDAPLVPDTDAQCMFCPAKMTCPAIEARAVRALSTTFSSVKQITAVNLPDLTTMPLDKLAYMLDLWPTLKAYFNDAYKIAVAHANAGGFVPNHKLVEAQARREWDKTRPPEDIARHIMALADTDDWDKVFPRTLIGITAADTLVKEAYKARAPKGGKKKAAEEAILALSVVQDKNSSGNLTLVNMSDKRPAADRATIAFKTVQVIERE